VFKKCVADYREEQGGISTATLYEITIINRIQKLQTNEMKNRVNDSLNVIIISKILQIKKKKSENITKYTLNFNKYVKML